MAQKSDFKKVLKTMGNNLLALRLAKQEDIATVAKAVKISPTLLNKIEKGEHNTIDLILLSDLCPYYNTLPKEVLKEKS